MLYHWVADDTTVYSVTIVVENSAGAGAIASMRTMLHNHTDPWSEGGARGYLVWGATDADIYEFDGEPDPWTLMGDATGGGRWGYRTADYGGSTYVTPLGCSTSVNGDQRTVTFSFTVKPAWAPASNQKLWGFAHSSESSTAWEQSNASYRIRLNYDAIDSRCIAPKDNSAAVLAEGVPPIAAEDIVWCDDFNSYCYFNHGNRWHDLRNNQYGSGDDGDFTYGRGQAFLEMEIRSTDYIVRLVATQHGDGFGNAEVKSFETTAGIPRKYLGPFNTISMGTGPGCKLDPVTGECLTEHDYWRYPQVYPGSGWFHTWIDRPAVLGGEVGASEGACCLPDLSCIVTDFLDCDLQGGAFKGFGSLCEEVSCCNYPWADADGDGDVDQVDFGAWQACYTGSNVYFDPTVQDDCVPE